MCFYVWFMTTRQKHILSLKRGVIVLVIRNGHSDPSSNLDMTVCISYNFFGKGMNPIILSAKLAKLRLKN